MRWPFQFEPLAMVIDKSARASNIQQQMFLSDCVLGPVWRARGRQKDKAQSMAGVWL